MFKKKALLVVFEGIEGSGKTYHCKKLYKKIIKLGLPSVITKEPADQKNNEQIRKILLTGKINKFNTVTDTLLYLASRSEHVEKLIRPSLLKKKVVLCDRFLDSTLAYQYYGLDVNIKMINHIHNEILYDLKPDLTFILKLNVSMALKRVNKRKFLNRYDKFSKKYYKKVQNGFLKLAKKDKKKYFIIDTSKNIHLVEKIIYNKFLKKLSK